MDTQIILWILAAFGAIGVFIFGLFKFILHVYFNSTNKRIDRLERGQDTLFKHYRRNNTNDNNGDDEGLT